MIKAAYLKVFELNPTFVRAYTSVAHDCPGFTLEERLVAARKAIELEPNNSYAHTTLSIVLRRLNRFDEAVAAARAAVAVDSQDGFAHCQTLALNYALQAMAHHSLGDSEMAATTLDRARNQLERSKSYHKNSGYLPYDAEVLLREAEAKINGEHSVK